MLLACTPRSGTPAASDLPAASTVAAETDGASLAPTAPAPATPEPEIPRLYAKAERLYVYEEPRLTKTWLGYVQAGESLPLLSEAPVPSKRSACRQFFRVLPKGYACADKAFATTDAHDPIIARARNTKGNLTAPLPYAYGESKGAKAFPSLPGEPVASPAKHAIIERRSTVAWTEEIPSAGETFLRTSEGTYVAKDKVVPYVESPFQGVHLGAQTKLPIAFFRKSPRPKYEEQGGTFVAKGESWDRLSWTTLTPETKVHAGRTFRKTGEGVWVDVRDATIVDRVVQKSPWEDAKAPGHRTWIEVAALSGWLIAYEGDTPVFATLISAGKLGAAKPQKAEPHQPPATTPMGTFRIKTKYRTTTLKSDLADGTDFVHAEVPHSQHFYNKYLLHTAYWHDAWGEGRSGGCVNLSPKDALFLFEWTYPRVPPDWHAYKTASSDEATWVVLHE